MSVIITQVFPDKIILGADSAMTHADDTQYTQEDVKSFQVKDVVVGFVGNAEHAAVLRYFLENCEDEIEDASFSTIMQLYNSYSFTAQSFGISLRSTNEAGMSGPVDAIHLILKGRAWQVHGLMINEIKDFATEGCGGNLALGALHAGADIVTALDAACTYNIHCKRPLVLYEVGQEITRTVIK